MTCVSGSDFVRPMPCWTVICRTQSTAMAQYQCRCTFREVGCIPVNVLVLPEAKNVILELGMTESIPEISPADKNNQP